MNNILLEIGTPVFFAMENTDGGVLEKEGVIHEIVSDGASAGELPVYNVLVEAEDRVYQNVPAAVIREIHAASGVEDGEYGFSEEDIERSFLETVTSLWYGMDPRGDETEHLDSNEEAILMRALNEDASGFFVDSDTPPEDED